MPTQVFVTASLLAVALGAAGAWIRRVAAVRRSISHYAAHWERAVPKSAGALEVVALGDSAAQAVGASDPARGWVGRVGEHVQLISGRPVHVVNLSRSGARIADVVSRQLPMVAERSPDLVVVGVGGNDVVGSWDQAALAEQIEELVGRLPANSVIADVPYFMHGRWQRRAAAITQMIHEAASRRGIVVAPVHARMRAQRPWMAVTRHYSADFFHPNDRGYQVWARAFIDAITSSPALSARLVGAESSAW